MDPYGLGNENRQAWQCFCLKNPPTDQIIGLRFITIAEAWKMMGKIHDSRQ